ncbi:signal peptide-containing protein [Theileria equi strain WA]|uniref:Signal peptide-containing protein n=1 Tax=Theileria equi strain WA TaxID=1537102 RepID=L0AYE3_THEEQ|nr:signal peptide-containing protein [Theileria equi strain WA]AFZ80278.1 signal peptide-containing protein [Theileria equi strain WA]|eukprot:XP_004829944.1 signal peptide-containing protein [Theileria equi strain WA]
MANRLRCCSGVALLLLLLLDCSSCISGGGYRKTWNPVARHSGKFKASLPTGLSISKPVVVVVNTYWGKDSPFNSKIQVDADLSDTFHNVKQHIYHKTGIPTKIQTLYICKDAENELNSATIAKDENKLGDHLKELDVADDTKKLRMHILLDLPVPVYQSGQPDPSKIGEYTAALSRYLDMLSDQQSDIWMHCKDNVENFVKESQNIAPKTPTVENEVEESHFVMPNKKIHLQVHHDYPKNPLEVEKRLEILRKMYLPIDVIGTLKFSLMCIIIRATVKHNDTVANALMVAPLVALSCQTRPGKFALYTLFHMIPASIIPQVLTDILPAHISEKLRAKRDL